MDAALLSLTLRGEHEVVLARQRARQLAGLLGFDAQDETRIATAVSEIARNAVVYAGGGVVEFRVEGMTAPQVLMVSISDKGPGIAALDQVLAGSYRSATGMGLGIVGAQRLMDQFAVDSRVGRGTTVVLKKLLPPRSALVDGRARARIAAELARARPDDVVGEIQRQNQELMHSLAELARRQEELQALNRELEDTNRGVVALYAELDERADHLRRADEVKGRFISNMSHEFRTPVNSILALTRLLLDGTDGELGAEQRRQVNFIRRSAESLSELVNDLLDLAKVEAGKQVVRPVEFYVEALFGALRGMLRPLLAGQEVDLVFEDPGAVPALHTDEAKVSQILRNFISNALKFTEKGEVRVRATWRPECEAVAFVVSDTGIGIDPADHERIFQEFSQVDNPIQRKVKGTGLGLPLCRKLAELLGGNISVESAPGVGSTFTATIPIVCAPAKPAEPAWEIDPAKLPVLAVDDSAETLLVYERYLADVGFQVIPARSTREARAALLAVRPKAIVLDMLLHGEDAWGLLTELKRREDTRSIPLIVASTVDDPGKGFALGADAYLVKPIDRHQLVQTIVSLTSSGSARRVLVVDDEEVSRYLLRQHLTGSNHVVVEADSGNEGLRIARAEPPDVICLDLAMPDVDGFEVLRRLREDPATREIPVVVVTSRTLTESERLRLDALGSTVFAKESLSREGALAALQNALRAPGGEEGS